MSIYKIIFTLILLCALVGAWFVYDEIYRAELHAKDEIEFDVLGGEDVTVMAERLEKEGVVRYGWLFRYYLQWKGIDRQVHHGTFKVKAPITMDTIAKALTEPGVNERTITILPGWDLRDIADYFIKEGIIQKEQDLFVVAGLPAHNSLDFLGYKTPLIDNTFTVSKSKPASVSFEGYLRPDTFRIFKNATLLEIVTKLIQERGTQFTDKMYSDIQKSGYSVHEILTMASIIEREVRSPEDRAVVADIFWRRHEAGMGLQADSTVHYAVGKKGEVFTTKEDRDTLNAWNTYKYLGLPPGPISNPGIESIRAAMYPKENDYWYFLTTLDTGEVKYGKTLEDHNTNVYKYLR